MRCKLTGAEEGPGCDEAAAAGNSGDCGGGAPPPSTSPTPSTSATSSDSPSPPPTPTPTPSSTSSADEEYLWGQEQVSTSITYSQPTPSTSATSSPSATPTPSSPSPPQSPTLTPSSTSSADDTFCKEIELGKEQEVDRLEEFFGSTHLSSTFPESEECLWGEEQEFDRLQVSMNITYSQEDEWEEEEEVDRLQVSMGTTHLNSTNSEVWGQEQQLVQLPKFLNTAHLSSTRPEIQDAENNETGGVFNNKSKLGDKEPVLNLDNFKNEVITGKIMLLNKKYGFFRRIAGDGSCFYRAFIFSYLENVVEIRDENKRKTEAARLRQRVEKYMLACFDDDLLPAFYGFESVVNLIEQGLPAGELYHMEMNEHVTSHILPLLRSLTEIEICTREYFYHAFISSGECYKSVFELCFREVRPGNSEANEIQVVALANALGIPVIVENLDGNSPVRLNPHHVYPSQESEAEALELEQSIDGDDSTTPMAHVEHDGSRNLSPAERRRLVTLLYRPGHYDIIYPK